MPLFLFHLRTPAGFERDDAGVAYADLDAAYLAACAAIPGVSADVLREGSDPMGCAFVIADADGRDLLVVPFDEMVRRRARPPAPGAPSPMVAAMATWKQAQDLLADMRQQHDALRANMVQMRALLVDVPVAGSARDRA